jgi:hypothetical protein
MVTQAKWMKTCSASHGVDLEISHTDFGNLAMQVFTKTRGSL